MLTFARATAAVLIAVLSSGPVAVCAGWQATPEARMACCAEGIACPMHSSDDQGVTERRAVTQADADSCCAAGEQDNTGRTANSPAATFVPPATAPTLLLPTANARTVAWERRVPDRAFAVSRNVLLAVFII